MADKKTSGKKASGEKTDDVTGPASGDSTADTPETEQAAASPEDSAAPRQDAEAETPAETDPAATGVETQAGRKPDEGQATDEPPESDDSSEGRKDETFEADGAPERDDEAKAEEAEAGPIEPEPMPAPLATEQVVIRKGGFVPMLLGGLAAAVIGFGMARYVLPEDFPFPQDNGDDAALQEISARLDTQSETIAALGDRVEGLGEGPDLSGLEAGQARLSSAVETMSGRMDEMSARLDALDARLTEVEKRPMTDGASTAAIDAYERELAALQEAIAAQRAEIESIAEEAREMEESAEETAQATLRRAALTRIQSALESGSAFASAVADLQGAGVDVPDVLDAAAPEGVATLGDLQDSFPDAAREALAVSRQVAGDGGGIGDFLRTQLGARSLTPREGDDPDAILSRAEAAVRDGRLTDALAEIETLPEEGRAALSDWSGQAARRLDALAAAEELAQDMN